MTDRPKTRIVVDEYTDVVERLDAIAESEGLSRMDMLRRAIRQILFLHPVPVNGNIPQEKEQEAA